MNEKFNVVKNFIILRYLKKFKTNKKLKKYQEKMLLKQMRYLKKNSNYFKNINYNDINSLKNIPLMNKEIMMNNFNDLNCVGVDKEKALKIAISSEKTRDFDEKLDGISVGLSSGTSGSRGLFIVSDKERALWAGGVLAKFLPYNNLLGHKIAFFLRADNNLYETIDSKAIKFRYFDIMKDMNNNIKQLEIYNPSIVVAPPSVLLLIGNAIDNNKININPVKIISVAEVLTKEDEEYLKKVFKLKIIHQAYQCTEGFLGYVCEYGNFHLNEDVVYIEKEYIDDKRFVPIITDFLRKSQPIVRYRLNDILVEKKVKCKCGFDSTIIEKIEGREDDIFIFYNDNGDKITVFPDFISRCIIYVKGIRNYKVEQIDKDNIIIYLDNLNNNNEIIEEFKSLAAKMNFICPNIEFKKYKFDLTKKMKRVERKF